ncbi:hypothetical protein D3C80_570260 [compost metagenome]
MQHHDDGGLPGMVEISQKVQHFDLMADIQKGRGLVQQQYVGLLGKRHGDPDALPLAARQFIHRPLGKVHRIGGDEGCRNRLVILPRPAGKHAVMRVPATTDQIGNDNALRRDRRLRQKAHALRQFLRRKPVDRLAIEQDLPGARRDQPRHAAEKCGLAAGIGADDDRDPAARNDEIQPFDDEGFAVASRKAVHGKGVAGHNEPPLRLTRTIR